MNIQNVNVEIRANGRAIRSYNHEGKVFVESRADSEYTIHIHNNNYFRVLVVASIDGLSVMDGEKASHDSGGYIVGGYQTYEIKGFRKDYDTVGAFKFTKKSSGYAASKGDSRNVGIISVAVFKEKQPIYNIYTSGTSSLQNNILNDPFYNDYKFANTCNIKSINLPTNTIDDNVLRSFASSSPQANNIGQSQTMYCSSVAQSTPTVQTFDHSTNWGSKVSDKVVSGTFERETLLGQFDIYYASKDGLKTLGIDVVPKREVAFPQGFNNQFCKPPANW